jgi:hypothetical protein
MIDHSTVVTPADDFVLIHDHAADRTSPSAQAFFASRIAAFIYFSSRVNFAATVFSSVQIHPLPTTDILIPVSRQV